MIIRVILPHNVVQDLFDGDQVLAEEYVRRLLMQHNFEKNKDD